jgi:hypothetical protein
MTTMAVLVLFAVSSMAHPHHTEADTPPQTFLYESTALMQSRAAVRAGEPQAVVAYQMLARSADALLAPHTSWSPTTGPWSVLNKSMALPAGVSRNEYLSIGTLVFVCDETSSALGVAWSTWIV